MKRLKKILIPLIVCALALTGYVTQLAPGRTPAVSYTLEDLPAYSGEPYVVLEDNQPDFPEEDRTGNSFETYSPLDSLGRCGTAYANVGLDLMPTEERGDIGQVKPSGWHTVKYDFVDGKYLYNRCHLIGYQLTGENANEENLITGTRYLNMEGMLPFENLVADYVEETGNHVLYRVTPVFEGEDLVARGVVMEGWSVEDGGEGVCFFVFAYNVQPGVVIDYATGESWAEDEVPTDGTESEAPTDGVEGEVTTDGAERTYILNTSSMKFHDPDCSGAADIKAENRETYTGSREALLAEGYSPCGVCKP